MVPGMPSCGSRPPGRSGLGIYAATKAAIRSLARTWAAEPAGRGIRVNALPPAPSQPPAATGCGPPSRKAVRPPLRPSPPRRPRSAEPAAPARSRPPPSAWPGNRVRSERSFSARLAGRGDGGAGQAEEPAASFLGCQAPTTTSTRSV
ncbi:SDR family oxidoreductase [Streptomyces mirabilis]|uniref:SDR family oxidoreductase n=1 Tax=Streptomyces mirabilis TaxID=68239 RepID=UPI003D9F979A